MAKFLPGNPGGPGRPPGVPTVKKILRASEILEQMGRHPITELVKIADESEDVSFKRDLWLTIQGYCETPLPPRTVSQTPEESVEAARSAMERLAELSKPLDPTSAPETTPQP
jgi:hypothetical protein